MIKRIVASATLALALVAANAVRPVAATAYTVSEQAEAATGDCLAWCVSCQTHHWVPCPDAT